MTAVAAAAGGGHLDVVRYLAKLGAAVDMQDSFGRTPLFDAVRGGHRDTVNFYFYCNMIFLIEISFGYQMIMITEEIAGIQKMQNAYLCSIYFIYEKHVFCFIFEYALLEFDVKWKLFPFNYLIFEIIMKVKGVMHSSFFIISAIIIHK